MLSVDLADNHNCRISLFQFLNSIKESANAFSMTHVSLDETNTTAGSASHLTA